MFLVIYITVSPILTSHFKKKTLNETESNIRFIKWNIAVLLISFYFTTHASVPILQQEKLEKTSYFSMGMNGFIGKMSDDEKTYRQILEDGDAEKTFVNILKNEKSTNEAKLYAACGLYRLNSKKLTLLLYTDNNEYITILQGDILYKKRITEVLKSISAQGCR